jgi:hypothetical protein
MTRSPAKVERLRSFGADGSRSTAQRPDEVAWTHRLFTAALRSHAERAVVSVTPSSQR